MHKPTIFVFVLVVLLSILNISSGAYFFLTDTEQSCFIEDVPEDTGILLKYANLDIEQLDAVQQAQPQNVVITVSDPNGRIMLSHTAQKKGRAGFTTRIAGEHRICLDILNSPRLGKMYRFGLKVQAADEAIQYSNTVKQEHFSAIIVELSKMNDRITARRKEQNYQKTLETLTRNETESANELVLYFFAFQTIIIISAMIFQVVKLRSFFKSVNLA